MVSNRITTLSFLKCFPYVELELLLQGSHNRHRQYYKDLVHLDFSQKLKARIDDEFPECTCCRIRSTGQIKEEAVLEEPGELNAHDLAFSQKATSLLDEEVEVSCQVPVFDNHSLAQQCSNFRSTNPKDVRELVHVLQSEVIR